jgi:cytochrome c biogenesis protein CcdA
MIGEDITLGIIIGAALVDSINPCVFGVLIFLIAFMTKVFKSKTKMLIGGILYTLVVYITYLLLGFGILKATLSIGIATGVYVVAASIAILAGLFEIKDFFWYGKGFSLQMIPGAGKRLEYFTKKIGQMEKRHPALLMLTTAALGFFVVLVELPCTGAPYFAILGLLAKGSYATAVPLLLLYNLIFILPLIVMIAIAYMGTSSEKLEKWRKKNRGLMRLVIGTLLIGLGVYMLVTIL